MANSFTTQILREGPRNLVVRVTGEIQGVASTGGTDIAPTAITSIATGSPPCTGLRVDRVKFSIPHGCPLDVNLFWDATSPELFFGAGGGDDGDFWNFGGITTNAPPGATGDIMFGTSGAAALTTATLYPFALIVEMVKQGVQLPI